MKICYDKSIIERKAVMCMKRLDSQSGRQIPYSAGTDRLEEFYRKQYELILSGNTDLATFELVMLGSSLDFIQIVRSVLGCELDGSEGSVNMFEEVLDALKRGIANKCVFDIAESTLAEKAAAYLGFLIAANIGGEWEDTENGTAVCVDGRMAFTGEFVRQRLSGETELSAVQYYRNIKPLKK